MIPHITIEGIIAHVAAFYRVTLRDVLSHRRDAQSVLARQVAMSLARDLVLATIPVIGRAFRRDYTTVRDALGHVRGLLADPQFAATYAGLRRQLLAPARTAR